MVAIGTGTATSWKSMRCYRRGIAAIHEFFNGRGDWPAAEKVYQIEAYILSASDGVFDPEEGLFIAYDALVYVGLGDEATRYRKEFYGEL
jgi:tellurite resistance protein